ARLAPGRTGHRASASASSPRAGRVALPGRAGAAGPPPAPRDPGEEGPAPSPGGVRRPRRDRGWPEEAPRRDGRRPETPAGGRGVRARLRPPEGRSPGPPAAPPAAARRRAGGRPRPDDERRAPAARPHSGRAGPPGGRRGEDGAVVGGQQGRGEERRRLPRLPDRQGEPRPDRLAPRHRREREVVDRD